MFPRAFRIARIRGIDVRADPTLLVFGALVVWTFTSRFASYGHATPLAVTMAVVGGALFFASILVHELGHALEAQHRGIEVAGITLFILGGVTEMHLEAERPGDELVIAGVGPYLSLFTAAVFGLVAAYVPMTGVAALRPVAEVAGMLGWINLLLALFNLIPGAPLDGGRVFRAVVWKVTGNRVRAIRVAAIAGQVIAGLMILVSLRTLLASPSGAFDGLWLGLVGWFMWTAARGELRQAATEELLGGRTVADLVTSTPPRLPTGTPLEQVAPTLASAPGTEAFPVATGDGRVVGVLHLSDVMAIDPQDRGARTTDEVMQPLDGLRSVTADTDLRDLVHALERHPVVVVQDADRVAGLLTPRQVAAALDRLRDLTQGRSRRTGTTIGDGR